MKVSKFRWEILRQFKILFFTLKLSLDPTECIGDPSLTHHLNNRADKCSTCNNDVYVSVIVCWFPTSMLLEVR